MRKIKPLNDFIFKKLFGEKGNEDILLSFLNAVLQRTSAEPIEEVEIIENKELTKELIEDKTGIIDVRARTQQGEEIDIEVQLTNQGNMEKRTIFYLSKLYINGIKQGEDYAKLPRVITINLLDFEVLGTKNYHSSFHFWEDEEKDYMLTDVAEIHFLEYPKFRRQNIRNFEHNPMARWLAFLEKDITEDTLKELVKMEPAIQKAEDKLEYLSSDAETMSIYLAREKSLHDQANMVNTAEQRGMQQGIQQGIQQERKKTAVKLLEAGIDMDTIESITELSRLEIEALTY